jgi:hypothetical protein
MQGNDGEPPEAVRACGRAGGNGGGVGCRWLERLQVAGAATAGRGRKGSNLQRGERRSRWLITDAVVAGRWSWQHVVVLVAQGGDGGRDVDGGGRKKKKQKKKVCSREK